MSVASTKNNDVWKELVRWRHYGEAGPDSFSLAQKIKFGATTAFAKVCLRTWTDTCRWHIEGNQAWRDDLFHGRDSYIFLMWHNRIVPFFAYIDSITRRRLTAPVHAIISASGDGEMLARTVRTNGGHTIRGSSSRNAESALRAAMAAVAAGSSPSTVGDGPRGPRYKLKPGPLMLAKATGKPIIFMTWACNRTLQFHRSWDQLMLPMPFSRLDVRFSEPFHVPGTADSRGIARARRELEARMMQMTEWADRETRIAWQFPKPKPGELLKRRKRIDLAGHHYDD